MLVQTKLHFTTEGLNLGVSDYAQLLQYLAQNGQATEDDYSCGGIVAELETHFAQLLGKEMAVFMPTGTLANHLAIKVLAGEHRRVIVQQESHIYNDSGDTLTTLSGINLIPLASGRATFTVDEVAAVIDRTKGGRVATKVGAISIESPVRRLDGQMFNYQQMQEIATFARSQDIKLHLDGARLFIASAYTGISPATYAALFDTVYISLYKCFNAASGAILVGPKCLLQDLYQTRRLFGGGLAQVWPYAAVANHYLTGFNERFVQAKNIAEEAFKLVALNKGCQLEYVPEGTNLYKLLLKDIDANVYKERLAAVGVGLRSPIPNVNGFWLWVNESLNQTSAAQLAELLTQPLAQVYDHEYQS